MEQELNFKAEMTQFEITVNLHVVKFNISIHILVQGKQNITRKMDKGQHIKVHKTVYYYIISRHESILRTKRKPGVFMPRKAREIKFNVIKHVNRYHRRPQQSY